MNKMNQTTGDVRMSDDYGKHKQGRKYVPRFELCCRLSLLMVDITNRLHLYQGYRSEEREAKPPPFGDEMIAGDVGMSRVFVASRRFRNHELIRELKLV